MREPFDSQTYYHVYNRGVDRRSIFYDRADFSRFYQSMYLFSDVNYSSPGGNSLMKDVLLSGHEMFSIDRKPLVSVVAFCLNSNHFHMMIREVEDDGISKFLHRLGMGYTKYFNRRYERSGSLFESTFKAKPLDYEEHLQLLPRYIHLNVLDGTGLDWRTNWPPDWEKAWGILDGYPWSSHSVFAYSRQELPVVDDEVVRKWFPTQDDYRQYLMAYRPYGAEELTFTRL